MGITAQAYRVHVPKDQPSLPFDQVKHERSFSPFFPPSQVIVRELTQEELDRPLEDLPELPTSDLARFLIWLMEPYRDNRDDMDPDSYEYSVISHEAFVKAHQNLQYHHHSYTDHRDKFDRVRDFIRECALNHYYADYG